MFIKEIESANLQNIVFAPVNSSVPTSKIGCLINPNNNDIIVEVFRNSFYVYDSTFNINPLTYSLIMEIQNKG
jgi:hypothetical protein